MAVYANENGTVQTLATDGEPLNILYQQYTATFIHAYDSLRREYTGWEGNGFEDQSYTLPFTPKAIIVEYNKVQDVTTSKSDVYKLQVTNRDIAIGENQINIAATYNPRNDNSTKYYHNFKVQNNTVIIPKTTYNPPSISGDRYTLYFNVIFFY